MTSYDVKHGRRWKADQTVQYQLFVTDHDLRTLLLDLLRLFPVGPHCTHIVPVIAGLDDLLPHLITLPSHLPTLQLLFYSIDLLPWTCYLFRTDYSSVCYVTTEGVIYLGLPHLLPHLLFPRAVALHGWDLFTHLLH